MLLQVFAAFGEVVVQAHFPVAVEQVAEGGGGQQECDDYADEPGGDYAHVICEVRVLRAQEHYEQTVHGVHEDIDESGDRRVEVDDAVRGLELY